MDKQTDGQGATLNAAC